MIYVTSVVVECCCVECGVLCGFKFVDTTGIDVCVFQLFLVVHWQCSHVVVDVVAYHVIQLPCYAVVASCCFFCDASVVVVAVAVSCCLVSIHVMVVGLLM